MGYWLKSYTDILEDMKYHQMSERAQLAMHEIFLVCKMVENGEITGQLPNVEIIAWVSRKPVEYWACAIPELIKSGIIAENENGYLIVNYVKRQEAIPDKTRQKQYRKRVNNGLMEGENDTETEALRDRHEYVTNRNGETDRNRIQNTETEGERINLALIDPLLEHFNQESKLSIPIKESYEHESAWFMPAREMLLLVDQDIGKAKTIITRAIKYADGKFVLSSPKSLLKTFQSELARDKRKKLTDDTQEFKAEEFLNGH